MSAGEYEVSEHKDRLTVRELYYVDCI